MSWHKYEHLLQNYLLHRTAFLFPSLVSVLTNKIKMFSSNSGLHKALLERGHLASSYLRSSILTVCLLKYSRRSPIIGSLKSHVTRKHFTSWDNGMCYICSFFWCLPFYFYIFCFIGVSKHFMLVHTVKYLNLEETKKWNEQKYCRGVGKLTVSDSNMLGSLKFGLASTFKIPKFIWV